MKVLLVMSPMFRHENHYLASTDNDVPLGLCYLAAVLERAGLEVTILDGQISKNTKEELTRLIDKEKFDVIGFSTVTPAALNTARLASLVKQKRPKITTLIGGVHPTVTGETVLKEMPAIDIAVFGEGERTIVELAEHLRNNRPLDDVFGLAFRRGDRIIRTAARPLIKNLDELPFPAYHLVKIEKYSPPPGLFFKKPIIGMIT
ncbi:MAG: cobalamin-dependent protein, partial [bacterium]